MDRLIAVDPECPLPRTAPAIRWARPTSAVHTAPANPNSVALAIATASASSENAITLTTGPKISVCAARASFDRPCRIVGATK